MPWFKVDDGFFASQKVTRIPRGKRWSAVGLWLLAGTWCSKELTDGFLPDYQFQELGGAKRDADALVESELWERLDGGWQFVEWAENQPTKEQTLKRRADDAARKRDRSPKDSGRTPDGIQADSAPPDPSRPDPARPGPASPAGSGVAARPFESDLFELTDEMRAWAREKVPLVDVELATDRFVDHWSSKAGPDSVKKDWLAVWRNWLRKDQQDAATRGTPKLSPSARVERIIGLGVDRTSSAVRLSPSERAAATLALGSLPHGPGEEAI